MTIPTNTFTTFDAVGNREDLTDMIYMISPTVTPFINSIPTTTATATYHEWQTVSLASADTTNARLQGDNASTGSSTVTARVGNHTQISDKTIRVSGTQDSVNKAGRKQETAYQVTLKGLELRRDMEAIVTGNQTSVAGNDTTAPKIGSLEAWLVTNSVRGSGGSNGGFSGGTVIAATDDSTQHAFTEAMLKQAVANAYSSGGEPDMIMVGVFNRQILSTFAGNSTKIQDVTGGKLATSVKVYESDFGDLKVVANRFQRSRTAFVLETDKFAMAYLPGRSFFLTELAKTGDSTQKQLLCEYTLEVRNEAASAVIADLTTS